MEQDRQRRNTQAELGRDVVLEDEEGTLYFQCKDSTGGGKVVTLNITLVGIKFEMYVEGQGLKSETFRFEELRKWEVRDSKKKGESKEVVLDFGGNRNPSLLVLISAEADKIVAEIRGRVEELIAQRKERGEFVPDIKTQSRDGQLSFSEEFKKEFAETYNDLLGKKWFQLCTSIVGTIISVFIIFGYMVATFVVVGITWDDSCNKPLQPWALVTGLVSIVHIILDIVRLPIVLIHTHKDHRYRIKEGNVKSILLNPLLWVTVLYVILCIFWIAWFIIGLVWVERYSCSSTISKMTKALTYAFWHPVVSLYVVIFSIVALWKGPLYL